MISVDAGGGDRLSLAVLTQYRMATTEQMHRVIAPSVRIEQTRRRLARLRAEGLVGCGLVDDGSGAMLRAFVEVDRATMGPERLAAKLPPTNASTATCPRSRGAGRPLRDSGLEEWRRRYPLFPRVLFVLDGTGSAGVENRISALRAGAGLLAPSRFLHDVPVLAVPLADLLHHGPSAPVWRPVHDPDQRVHWLRSGHPSEILVGGHKRASSLVAVPGRCGTSPRHGILSPYGRA